MDTWEHLEQECMQCHGCGLAETRTHVVFGDGAKMQKFCWWEKVQASMRMSKVFPLWERLGCC